MNIEHDSERISIHDFNELEGNNLRGFLNIKRKGIISQNPFVDSFRVADNTGVDQFGKHYAVRQEKQRGV